jgi:hypothetical protein
VTRQISVVGIGGSLSAQSSSLAALQIAREGAQIQPITREQASSGK